jgi:UDP-glucose 4-epimerase
LITGGAGFIGSHLVDAALIDGHEVAVIDDLSSGRRENVPGTVRLYEADIRDSRAVGRAFAEFQPVLVSHQAAQKSVAASAREPLFDAEVNVIGSLNVLEAARASGVTHLVFASTGGAIYGEIPDGAASESRPTRPHSPYAAAKASVEHYLQVYSSLFGMLTTSLRYANVYGPRQDPEGEAGVVAIFAQRALAGQPVTLYARRTPGDGGGLRDYVHVADVVRAHQLTLRESLTGTFNVGTGVATSTGRILELVEQAAGKKLEVRQEGVRPGDVERSVLDPAALVARGWQPRVGLAEGIAQTVQWFRELQG